MAQKKTRKPPCIATSVLTGFLKQIFGYRAVSDCPTFESAISSLDNCNEITLPEGFNESVLLADRFNLRQELWHMKKNSAFVQSLLECMNEEGFGYLIMVDSTIPGKDSLFLCAITVDACNSSDPDYHVRSWNRDSAAPVSVITGAVELESNEYLIVTAMQLSSFKQHVYCV